MEEREGERKRGKERGRERGIEGRRKERGREGSKGVCSPSPKCLELCINNNNYPHNKHDTAM